MLGLLDVAPATPGHALVVPRSHRADLLELSDSETAALFVAARNVAVALRSALGCPGIWISQVSGEAAWQDVFHVHVHVIPRYSDDTVQPPWGVPPWRPPALSAADLDAVAAQIRAAL